jgi:inorganic pyrophosphatase
MFRMQDEQGPTPKVVCVPSRDPRLAYLSDITDLDRFDRLEIQHFFEVYKVIEPGKRVEVARGEVWAGRDEAEEAIRQAYERGRGALTGSA